MMVSADRRGGFTLIEMLVVVTIISVLATLLIPTLQSAQNRAMTSQCLAKCRSIAASIRYYSYAWDGWTNPDREAYVKEFGFKLSTEEGHFGEAAGTWASDPVTSSYSKNFKAKEFRCTIDEAPWVTSHAVPSSYRNMMGGVNMMTINNESNKILMVKEVKRQHFVGDVDLQRTFAFADLHTVVGPIDVLISGFHIQIWDPGANTPEAALALFQKLKGKEVTYSEPPDWETIWVADYFMDTAQYHSIMTGATPAQLNAFASRIDGYIRFPEPGTWTFDINHDDGIWFWIDINRNGEVDGGETYELDTWSRNTFVFLNTYTVSQAGNYQYAIAHENFPTNIRMQIRWEGPGIARQIVSSRYLLWDSADQ